MNIKRVRPAPSRVSGDPFARFLVMDRLEVGPVKVEPRKISAPYTIFRGNKSDRIEIVYNYEEDVFSPDEPSSVNLASMIVAQIAINYGLFCKTIVFDGLYDNLDQKFILEMMQNTAREIYVKKFLEPNPFLERAFSDFPAVKKKSYSQASLQFPGKPKGKSKHQWALWPVSDDSHCILSSGGKDSLLSYGLLNELEYETHSIFVNESGRHWFTAMNAYRHFKANVPNTARVWVNSDRVFSWFLRHLPFIRRDFGNIRSDEYPIRLWTVAAFLFGALPLMKKRGIGRLIIGDEYDTTDKTSFNGITHYNGLYDQSRHFDEGLSRYFMRKGWSIKQFSILRPLSEMLIEKILVERYPDLFKHQVSCHAAHKADDKTYPCGKCEKCRRIVGMVMAIGADPGQCGYNEKQITDCLAAIAAKGVHQEGPGTNHLLYLLSQKNLIELPDNRRARLKDGSEVLKLRFDKKRSPGNAIPLKLRPQLYKIFLEHAEGAITRKERGWVDFDLWQDSDILNQPYPFELTSKKRSGESSPKITGAPSSILWAELTWPEAENKLKEMDIALLPVGAIEQHGPHLTLDIDAFDADYLARQVAQACSDPKPLVLPLIPYGVSYHHEDFKGTISINNDTLAQLVYDVGLSAARNGITKLVIINGHGGNSPALNYAAQMINRDAKIFACVDTGETSDFDMSRIVETPNDVHAGEFETSTSLAIRPDLVMMDKAEKQVPEFSNRYLDFTSKRSVPWYTRTKKISRSGIMGDPTKATAEKGRKMWELMIAHLTAFVEDLKDMTLDEIYQKRY